MIDYDEIEEFQEKFESRILWLQKNIPPDDIYGFSLQALLAAEFFIYRLMEKTNINEAMDKDITTNNWVKYIIGLRQAHELNHNFKKLL